LDTSPYFLPADELERRRLRRLHELDKILYEKNVLAPIQDLPGTRILDLGTGSGTQNKLMNLRLKGGGLWAIQVADEFANAFVKGMDLAPIQPRYVPSNCSFYVGDMTEDLDERSFPDGSMDLVHLRFVYHRRFQRLIMADMFVRECH
jgi:SAM-dependent methyltransferase